MQFGARDHPGRYDNFDYDNDNDNDAATTRQVFPNGLV